MAEVAPIEPSIESITIKGKLLNSFETMSSRLSTLQMFSLKSSGDSLTIARVESRNIQKKPFLFFIFDFNSVEIKVTYSIGLDTSAKIRRLYVLKNLIAVLSLVSDAYEADNTDLLQHLDSSIDDVLGSLSQSYSSLFNNYDSLFNKYRELKRLNIELTNSNKNLSVQAAMFSSENTDLKDRLKKLETYSDESLMSMVQEWIESHDGTIDVNEFSNTYHITPPRVEQILNQMVSLGYIELKG
ncbi:MAG: hypothetical protein M1504_01090 [Candidatus Marsarchaeota archaeon]|nr:hypothetical protein [Candidatus Marsarchaeota archaeon]